MIRFRPLSRRVATLAGLLTLAGITSAAPASAAPAGVPGYDVSSHQGNVDAGAAYRAGARFAYIKATEGLSYRNPYLAQQYNGAYRNNLIRGGYHYARPDRSDGAAQARFFVASGGGWSPDGRTLPGALDLENSANVSYCYGKSAAGMVAWIRSFADQYRALTTRWPVIYTRTNWWQTCTGNSTAFRTQSPLWLASYGNRVGSMPGGWSTYSFWQWADRGVLPGDQNVWNGTSNRLQALACDSRC